jgi:LPXTG-site transpeptidase (sortase) family protein
MKDQPLCSPHHGPPVLYRSRILGLEESQDFLSLVRAQLGKVPISLLLIGIGVLIYALGFGRLITNAWDEPSPLDQVAVAEDSDLGFVPYLVSSEPIQDDLNAPAITLDIESITQTGVEPSVVENSSVDDIQNEQLVDRVKDTLDASAEAMSVWLPRELIIPKIQLEAPIQPVSYKSVEVDGKTYEQWFAPDSPIVGWHQTSAQLGTSGNTVLNGHHNIFGEVFRDLSELEVGDQIVIQSGQKVFEYVVGTTLIVPERNQSIETRLENARWIQPSSDERITIVTCWPYESNTHRVIVVAVPVEAEGSRDFMGNKALE